MKSVNKTGQTLSLPSNQPQPTPLIKIDLRDGHAIRREMGALYRDMRAGRLASQDGTRLAYVLDLVRKAHETAVLQDRIELLELTLNNRK